MTAAITLSAHAGAIVLLAWAVVTDLRKREIPNAVPAGIALLWLASVAADGGWAGLPSGLLAGAIVFVGAALAYRFGLLGGGDVKLLAALALWAGFAAVGQLLAVTALLGGGLALLWLALDRASFLLPGFMVRLLWPIGGGQLPQGRPSLPYGVAIAAAGAWLVHRQLWL